MPLAIFNSNKMRKFFKVRGPQGVITLEDGKTRSRSVVVKEGALSKVLVRDILCEVLVASLLLDKH